MPVTGLATVLLATAILLVIVSAVQPLAKRIELSETVLLAIVGIILGGAADLVLHSSHIFIFDTAAEVLLDFPINSEGFLLIFLPILVFQAGLAIDVRRLAHEMGTVLLLAIVAVVLSTAMIGLALYPFSGMPLIVCLLVGSIVATTDPSAVAGIFREIGAATRLTRLVEGESLLNDAAAISIFSTLIAAIIAHKEVHFMSSAASILISFVGAVIVGFVFARLALWMIVALGSTSGRAGEITLTVALPYISYIVCDDIIGFSGVVAAAAAGLTLSAYGPSTFRPQTWRFLNEIWQQIVFWAGSLLFVLASMLVPRLLIGMTKWDCVLILIATIAGLIARAIVIFGMLPILAATKISPPVPTPFKATMVWGGLRGAITLALALAVTENELVSTPISHFVGIIATGFVLITLLVNGTTLRAVVVYFRLNELTPIDQAVRHQIISIGLGRVRDKTRRTANEFGFNNQTTGYVIEELDRRIEEEQEANTFDTAIGNRQRITLALITIAAQERSILLDLFRMQGLPRRVMETLLRSAEAAIDGAWQDGRYGYVKAMHKRLHPPLRFRIAQNIHRTLHIDRPLMYCMMERFEILLVSRFVSISLTRFVKRRIEPTLGTRVAEIISEVLDRQNRMLDDALETMRMHYQGYIEALEARFLKMVSLRFETEEYDGLLTESLISEELHQELDKGIEKRYSRYNRRLKFNLKSGIEQRVQELPCLRGIPQAVLYDLSLSMSIYFVFPGQKIYSRGERIKNVFFISNGLFETHIEDKAFTYGAGDVLGANELIARKHRTASIYRSLRFGYLLTMPIDVFKRLVSEYPVVRHNLVQIDFARNRPEAEYDSKDTMPLLEYMPPAIEGKSVSSLKAQRENDNQENTVEQEENLSSGTEDEKVAATKEDQSHVVEPRNSEEKNGEDPFQ
ncbi:cation:proton antiporter [Commensalibacter papalotli (ex Botero et al. 2024)]|uniref:NhaP-type Na+/H+ or K+/H+ antiporter (NhaP) (PDB:4CZB) n=1 Tax=Commensalibacter papalotli (ex Botero et al. 2024) TaxID=2972766 RepID=A0ABM9HPZ1_9PROT|nr:cation:proton antiporter [Commensalibacter papalotli (ex Botero et al. 2024)]CAI3931375.1 NhaP-type Na+/H+ or K+/H+ antiporter (NhaP) (PDB:4CZB) [Commensalibacter papalotli (ex Botero et al. 2024)]CAI3944269.1 NhaP-type Na+/H+ or K+/H+ antiporter (NhaP) (PDB:4CZB) [Commensalibacter papalotli (ex Botero et al. 2024)]